MIERLSKPTDAASLVVFRFALGAIVTMSALRMLAYGWIEEIFVKPKFFFHYWGLAWVRPLPGPWMVALFAALATLGVVYAFGLAHRIAAPLLCLGFTYVQAIDVTNWLNHYYLVSLLLFTTSFMPLGRGVRSVPAWCTYLLRFQIGVVYVHAGLAKLTSDWLLHAQPMDIWLHSRSELPVLGALFGQRWVAYAFSWAGFLFDTTIVFFMMWRRARPWAYAVVVGFHVMVGILFPIGMFPVIMVAGVLVFFEPSWPRRVLRFLPTFALPTPALASFRAPRLAFVYAAAAFCLVQALAPLRHHLYGGNVAWHEQGMRFSWKVMVREKNASVAYRVETAKRTLWVNPRKYLTDRQEREFSTQPDLVMQLAHRIADDYRAEGDVRVRVDAMVSLNGRPAAPLIDPHVDLARVEDGLGKANWILPEPAGPPIHLRSWSAVASR